MILLEESDELRAIVAPSLRLVFRWGGDRWTHSLDVEDGPTGWRPIARTFEMDADGDDPARVASPAFQQLQFQRGGEGVYALVVGQAGPHHFSAAFFVAESGGGAAVEVDVADRCRGPVAGLASTYRVDLPLVDVIDADVDRVVWSVGGGSGRLEFAAWGMPGVRARIAIGEAGRGTALVQAFAGLEAEQATRVWRYRWQWSPGK